ncbi:Hypothetical protein, putative [Bodo saltans]|uniref:Uncharacterized protein n=1 Tax=Bodo saltans TaxID=75058 RepID=A0A0S4IVA1_BODSA|nr:Hypothetical protein, putative [Bodo saltans]|eukprot:CUG02797.1 Hypothetical protein, putative [Bodo saltans]
MMPPRLSSDERICFQRTLDILEATAALLSQRSGGGVNHNNNNNNSSQPTSPVVAAGSGGDTTSMLHQSIIATNTTVASSYSSGGSLTSPTAARGVGNGSFGSATAVSPFPVVGASFTPIAFLLFQTNLLAVVRDVFVAISASPSAVALVAPRLSQDMWLEVLMKYLALQKHQSSAECTVLEAMYVLSGILQQGETSSAFAQRPTTTTTSGGGLVATAAPVTTTTAAKPPLRQLLLVVEEDDILVMLDRLEHGYHNVTVRNFALGTLRLWLCSRPLSSSSAPSTTQLQQQQLTDPTTTTSELSSSSHYLSSRSDIAPLREAVGAVMAWILTADAAAGRVFFVVDSEATTRLSPIAPSDDNYNLPTDNNREHRDVRKNGGGPSHGSSRRGGVVEFTAQQQQHRVLPQQLRFTLMTVAEILSGFVLSDSTYVPHGVLAQQRVDALLSNLILIRRSTLQHHATKLNLPRRSAATNGGGGMSSEVAAIDASIETLLLCTEAISRLQDVGALMRALLDVDTPWPSSPLSSSSGVVEAQSLQASRWLRCTIQTLLSARRLDDILAALHDSRVIDGQQTLWNVLQRSIISDANNAAANADVLNHSNQNISGQQPSTSGDGAAQAEIALSVSMIIVAASRQPTRRVMLREMCLVGQLYRHLISLVHSAFLSDGHRGEMFVLLYGPDGELLNSVQFLDQFTASGGGDTADSGVSNRHDDDVSRRRRHHNPSSSSLAGISTSKSSAIGRDQMTQSLSSWNKQPEVLLDAVKYILDPARSTPLRETLEWMSQDHNGHRHHRGGGGLPQRSTLAGISTSKSSAIGRDQMTQSLSSWNKQPEVLLDAVKYILDPARSTPLRETLEWMSQDHNGHRHHRGGGGLPQRSTSALPAALVEKRHTLATALISWAVLQTVSPS